MKTDLSKHFETILLKLIDFYSTILTASTTIGLLPGATSLVDLCLEVVHVDLVSLVRLQLHADVLDDIFHQRLVCRHLSLLHNRDVGPHPGEEHELGPLGHFVPGLHTAKLNKRVSQCVSQLVQWILTMTQGAVW